jgi:hypothetical protein
MLVDSVGTIIPTTEPAMTVPRESPYVYATWLSKLMGGDNQCEWAIWFQAHHKITKRPNGMDFDTYQINHTALLHEIRDDLVGNGYTVSIEAQNYFEVVGQTARLAGRPDIIAFRDDETLVIDGKTGNTSAAHNAQVLIYMWSLPRAQPKYKGKKFSGMLIYKSGETKSIAANRLDSAFIKDLGNLMGRVTATEPPLKTPSLSECGYCPITDEDCADRVTDGKKPDDAPPETDIF